ncbi:S66 family peptidase [Effusibacillus consociatus]|uniref:S66 peptidase family protein n=1 Tax=Effusibacillus consociatus TaxID=1117041 RepID=A0ABV9PZQ5_9BACL
MEVIRPQRLELGDTIGVVSPSSPVASICPRRFQRGITHLQSMGFEVIVGNRALTRTGHTAGSIQERVEDLHQMYANPNVKAIISTIGGYNSNQLLDQLDYKLICDNPKILMGYSDITTLLIGIHTITGQVTFLGPAILPQFGEFGGLMSYTRDSFERVVMQSKPIGDIHPSKHWTEEFLSWDINDDRIRERKPNSGLKVLKSGVAKGPILAGNIGTMLLLSGTPYFPKFQGVILCLEDDEDESPATIDRYLTQMRQIGIYDQIAGLIIGRFNSKVGFTETDSLESILEIVTRGYDFPIVYDADFGHTDPMMVLPNGIQAILDASDCNRPQLTILEPAVL